MAGSLSIRISVRITAFSTAIFSSLASRVLKKLEMAISFVKMRRRN